LRILFLTHYFAPDTTSNCIIMTELARELSRLGHDITVVTSFPHYDHNVVPEEYRWRIIEQTQEDRVRVYRTYVYLPQQKRWVGGRFLSYASYNVMSTIVSVFLARHDVILAPSPPLTVGITACVLSKRWKTPYVYNVQDIFPEVAVELGVLRNPTLIRFFEWLERLVYDKAAAISVLSEGFRRNVLSKGVCAQKIRVIPNLVDVEYIRPMPKDNPFARQHQWHDRFVVMYAGNVGRSQSLETLLEAACLLRDLSDLQVAIVGNGAMKMDLEAMAQKFNLYNVTFLPFQPREVLPEMYAAANVSLVILKGGIGERSVPSKIYTIMASGRPMITSLDPDSEVWRVVDESRCGLNVLPENPQALANVVRRLHNDPALCAKLGSCGRQYVVAHYSKESIARQYDCLFRDVVAGRV